MQLYKAVSALVAGTRDALAERLQSVHDTASLLSYRMMDNMGYGQQRLKDIVEKEAEEQVDQQRSRKKKRPRSNSKDKQKKTTTKEQQQDDDEQYDRAPKIKLVYEGKRVKEFRVTGNLNNHNTEMIMANIAPHIEMRTKVIHSFKSEIHRGAGEIMTRH